MNRNIAKPFAATLSLLDVATDKTNKYKCFHGEDVQLTVTVVGEDGRRVDLSNMSVKIYFTLDKNVNEPVYRQDTGIVVDKFGVITVMLEKSYIRIGNNTLKIVLYDEDQTVFLQPLIITCIDPLIGEVADLEIPDDIDVRDEFYDIRRIMGDLQDVDDDLRSEVEKIHNEFYNVKVIDLKNEEDFDINNISTCVNRVFSTIESYTTVKLNADLCYITSPINITMKEGCELILNCKIKCKTDFDAININGNRVLNNVFIKSLESCDKVNFNTILGSGLTLDNYYNSSVSIGEMLGFNIGLLIKGTLGSQYNKIDFFSISNCNEPIKLLTTEETQWVNENTFTGGRIGGNVGITLNGISGKDIINNNKFYNIGFEGVKELLIKSIGARYNYYFNPRVLENYPNSQWVDETGSCIGNKYYFTFPVNINMFKLEYLGQIIGTITNGTKTISQTGAICDWDITSDKMAMQYNYYLNGLLMTDKDFGNAGGTITLDECFKEVYCKLSTSTRILRIAKHLLYNGFSFNLYITSASSGTLKLEYYNKNGGITSGTNFLGNGVYKVTMYNDLLVYTKIGEEFKMV